MTEVILNGSKLYAIAHASTTAEIVNTHLALRDRIRTFSDIARLRTELVRSGEKIIEKDYFAYWKGQEDAGMGVIVYARKGKLSKFQWHYSMKEVALVGMNGKDEKIETGKPPVKHNPVLQAQFKRIKSKKTRLITKPKRVSKPATAQVLPKSDKLVCIALRPDFTIQMNVPSDFSKKEADFIASALKNFSL